MGTDANMMEVRESLRHNTDDYEENRVGGMRKNVKACRVIGFLALQDENNASVRLQSVPYLLDLRLPDLELLLEPYFA